MLSFSLKVSICNVDVILYNDGIVFTIAKEKLESEVDAQLCGIRCSIINDCMVV